MGSASAFALMQSGMFSEMVLIDADHDKAEGEALDISHGTPFARPMKIYAGGYDDIVDASIIVITAGANQKPGETRLDLVKKNIGIFKTIIPEIKKRDCKGILLIVANPVDILTYTAVKLSGFPENRVIGSGTVLDTARLKEALGSHLQVDSRSVHAFIIGEHGDSEIAAWSSANVSGIDLNDFCEMRGHYNHHEAMEKIANDVKNSAYEIIAKKHATYYGIAMSVKRICEAIVRDEKSIMPISSMMHGEYGIEDVALSMPAIVGNNAIFHAGPIIRPLENDKFQMVSVGPTTSMRMEKFEYEFVKLTGVRVIIGKGGMKENTERACKEFGAIHCVFPAGNAVVAATEVEEIVRAEWRDLGMPETLWNCRVKEFGPLIVSIDTKGNNMFEENKVIFNERKDAAYEKIAKEVGFIK